MIYIADSQSTPTNNPGFKQGIRIGCVTTPHIAIAVNIETMRNGEHASADRLPESARGIEFLYRRERRISAFGRPAPVEHPDTFVVAVG